VTKMISEELIPAAIERMWVPVDASLRSAAKQTLLESVYGKGHTYGVVEPTQWPSPTRKQMFQDAAQANAVLESAAAAAAAAGGGSGAGSRSNEDPLARARGEGDGPEESFPLEDILNILDDDTGSSSTGTDALHALRQRAHTQLAQRTSTPEMARQVPVRATVHGACILIHIFVSQLACDRLVSNINHSLSLPVYKAADVHLLELAELLAADEDVAGRETTAAHSHRFTDLLCTDQGAGMTLNQSLSNTTLATDSSGY
jgi:hypothetical protein